MHQYAIYKYSIYADVNNVGRVCVFQTTDCFEAKRQMKRMREDSNLNGYYANPEMRRKLEGFENYVRKGERRVEDNGMERSR